MPCAFKKDSVLRICDFGFTMTDAEKGCVKLVVSVDRRRRFYIILIAEKSLFNPSRFQFFIGQEGDRFDAVPEISPERVYIVCAGKSSRHADDCNTSCKIGRAHV